MADNLFPSESANNRILEAANIQQGPIGYRPSVEFNYVTGDFTRDGRHKLQDATGIEAWREWCVNCIQTERFKHLAYNSDYGIDLDAVFAAETMAEAESILTREINDAIMADPYERTAYIDSIKYKWLSPEQISVTATIVGIDDVTIDITAFLAQEGGI